MLKALRVLSACALITALAAPMASANNIVGDTVTLRTLDKVTAQTKDFDVKVGDSLDYGSLRIDVKHCERKPPEETPETYAFLQIFDNRLDGSGEQAEAEKLFSGWMFGSNPALSSLEHRVYDVWVIGCQAPVDRGAPDLRQ